MADRKLKIERTTLLKLARQRRDEAIAHQAERWETYPGEVAKALTAVQAFVAKVERAVEVARSPRDLHKRLVRATDTSGRFDRSARYFTLPPETPSTGEIGYWRDRVAWLDAATEKTIAMTAEEFRRYQGDRP